MEHFIGLVNDTNFQENPSLHHILRANRLGEHIILNVLVNNFGFSNI